MDIQQCGNGILLKKYIFYEKPLAICDKPMYTVLCCGMIAVKREVAVFQQWETGFPWSECQVRKLTTSHCTKSASL